jgi:hypothetical protein
MYVDAHDLQLYSNEKQRRLLFLLSPQGVEGEEGAAGPLAAAGCPVRAEKAVAVEEGGGIRGGHHRPGAAGPLVVAGACVPAAWLRRGRGGGNRGVRGYRALWASRCRGAARGCGRARRHTRGGRRGAARRRSRQRPLWHHERVRAFASASTRSRENEEAHELRKTRSARKTERERKYGEHLRRDARGPAEAYPAA